MKNIKMVVLSAAAFAAAIGVGSAAVIALGPAAAISDALIVRQR